MLVFTMSTPKLFIETSVYNFYFDGKQGRKCLDAIRLFDKAKSGKYLLFSSDTVEAELEHTSGKKRDDMKRLILEYGIVPLKPKPEVDELASRYIALGIIPAKYWEDAMHIAATTVNELDCIVSCNMGHIVKPKTMIGAGLVNIRSGYKWVGISTPTEILDYDQDDERRMGTGAAD